MRGVTDLGDASPPHTRWSCVMRRAAVEKRWKNVEKTEVFRQAPALFAGKSDDFPAQNALKSGVEHQISVFRKASVFSGFSPAFPMLPCASRKTTGRAAARLVVGTGDGAGSARADRRKIFGGEWKKSSDSYESELLIVPQTGIEPVRVSLPTGF